MVGSVRATGRGGRTATLLSPEGTLYRPVRERQGPAGPSLPGRTGRPALRLVADDGRPDPHDERVLVRTGDWSTGP